MRKDWDYVDFADYESDTRDLVNAALSVSEEKDERIRQLEMLFFLAVKAAGGKVDIFNSDLSRYWRHGDFAWRTSYCIERDSIIFESVSKLEASSDSAARAQTETPSAVLPAES